MAVSFAKVVEHGGLVEIAECCEIVGTLKNVWIAQWWQRVHLGECIRVRGGPFILEGEGARKGGRGGSEYDELRCGETHGRKTICECDGDSES